jgi:hypothetical protein
MSSQKEISYVEIQKNSGNLHKRWKSYKKNEAQGAQTFLNEFFECFGIKFDPNNLPYEFNTGQGFADCYIKGKVIIEMKDSNKFKNRSELIKALPQAEKYWRAKQKETNYIVLCNFKGFIIFDTRDSKKIYVSLAQLEQKIEQFSFLFDSSPYLVAQQEAVSRYATEIVGTLYLSLNKRLSSLRQDEVDTFILQCVFCMFAEDVGYLPTGIFTRLVNEAKEGIYNSADLLTQLFKMMDEREASRKQQGLFENVRWFNGPLFKVKPEIVLTEKEIDLLESACAFDWGKIKPEIFGVLFESSVESSQRHEDGMHFTSEEDILKIIKPCIIDDWEERLLKANSLDSLTRLHSDLKSYRVLDPACGSGNFLLVAYREIKRIESRIFHKSVTASGKSYSWVQNHMGHFNVKNIYGIELNNFPVLLARVSLWITKKMVQMDLCLDEQDLPLENLSHIVCADALEVKWNDVDVVVGNPPFIGCKQIRSFRGNDYFDWLTERFRDHSQMSDYCTYWYEKVLEDVSVGTRVGLVSTNTVTQTNSRAASLDKIEENGGTIFNAQTSFKWSGAAKVHVSIVNYINKKKYSGIRELNGEVVKSITSRLTEGVTREKAFKLSTNKDFAFVGPVPNGKGFVLSKSEAKALIRENINYKKVIKKYLTGEDLNQTLDQSASRYIIDFQNWELQECKKFKKPFDIVKKKVKPQRDAIESTTKDAQNYKRKWWLFGRSQMKLRSVTSSLKKIIVTSRVSKHPIFMMLDNSNNILPADSTVSVASDSFEVLGVMQSSFHTEWYKHQCSTLKGDLRYTNTTVFDTFPFPAKSNPEIGKVMEDISSYRAETCKNYKVGLTTIYNELTEGGHTELFKLHVKLDKEVARAYGFKLKNLISASEIIDFLTTLNHEYYRLEQLGEIQKLRTELNKKIIGKKKSARKVG